MLWIGIFATDTGNNSQKESCDATESNGPNRSPTLNRESVSGKYISRLPAKKHSVNAVTPNQCELDQSEDVFLQGTLAFIIAMYSLEANQTDIYFIRHGNPKERAMASDFGYNVL